MHQEKSRRATVKLTYFKDCGKYYDSGSYETHQPHDFMVYAEVDAMMRAGNNPGLREGAVLRNGFAVLVEPDNGNGVPYLLCGYNAYVAE
jgi:hypothetical protein